MSHRPSGGTLTPLHFMERRGRVESARGVVEPAGEGPGRRTWSEVARRARSLAAALRARGLGRGARVATLAWNHAGHVEAYFGVPGAGAALVTVNVRLGAEQIGRILEAAGTDAVLADPEFTEVVERAWGRAQPGRRFVFGPPPPGWTSYETLVEDGPGDLPFADVREDDPAALCFTSGTTGDPKGVAYSHRAIALHTLAICLPDAFAIGERDRILPVVPMFHANGWGLVHAAAMTGAELVLPGPRPDAARIARLLREHRVTFAAGVPTVWGDVLHALRRSGAGRLDGLRIHSGGAPTSGALAAAWEEEFGVEIITGWGMTELTPVGAVNRPRADMDTWPEHRRREARTAQGTLLPFVEGRLVDEDGRPVPRDGRTPGELLVRGPWVASEYLDGADPGAFLDGWLRTGDVATLDPLGILRLVDRSKDLIRSGGEWIPSVAVEHALLEHPHVREAAVVAVPHPRWGERPWAVVVPAGAWADDPGRRAAVEEDPSELWEPLRARFPSWWIPDGVRFVERIPRTATGKPDKRRLRRMLREA